MDDTNIETLYRNLKPRLEILEGQRKIVIKKIEKLKKACLIIGITIGVIAFTQGLWWVSFMVLAVGLLIYAVLYQKYRKTINKKCLPSW